MSLSTLEWLLFTRRGSRVQRYHTVPMLMENSVGEHSFNACILCIEICRMHGEDWRDGVLYLLGHDLPEQVTGDIPATAHATFSGLKEVAHGVENGIVQDNYPEEYAKAFLHLPPRMKAICKLCDTLELVFHCLEETRMGNKNALSIARKGYSYAMDHITANPWLTTPPEMFHILGHLEKELVDG